MEPILGTLIVITLFLARFAIPFALTLAFGYGMNRIMERREPRLY